MPVTDNGDGTYQATFAPGGGDVSVSHHDQRCRDCRKPFTTTRFLTCDPCWTEAILPAPALVVKLVDTLS